jgi:hypothetical protein
MATHYPDGKWLATVSIDTTAALWQWRSDDLIAEACQRVPADPSKEQLAGDTEISIRNLGSCVEAAVPMAP